MYLPMLDIIKLAQISSWQWKAL